MKEVIALCFWTLLAGVASAQTPVQPPIQQLQPAAPAVVGRALSVLHAPKAL